MRMWEELYDEAEGRGIEVKQEIIPIKSFDRCRFQTVVLWKSIRSFQNQTACRIRKMIEISSDEFERNMEKYFNDLLNGRESISVCKDGRKIVLVESIDYSILNSAIDIAKLILNK